ncbi:T-cell surface antigen CD2-like [Conger conger]|uniref:T-cell surface antigen CD2-like n=1 Tax=Conger conger TaxID=82655 RepID=UPI002A5AF0FF|nr:T-cell surface antigen CD2-like [Conger conger]
MGVRAFHTCCMLLSLFSGESCGQTIYGTVGEDVYLHLRETNGRSFHDIQWSYQNKLLAKTESSIKSFAEVVSNGTLKLHTVRRNYSGVYTAKAYDDQGIFTFNESSYLFVMDPPVIELVLCTQEVSVFHCVGENGPDAVYEWRVSIQNQGHRTVSNHTGKYLALKYSSGNISCTLKIGNFNSQSETYSLFCKESGLSGPELKWCVSMEVLVMLGLLCFMMCGISVAVQICLKQRNSNVTSEARSLSVEMAQDDGIVYSEVRVGKQRK